VKRALRGTSRALPACLLVLLFGGIFAGVSSAAVASATTSNAIGILIDGTIVSLYVPEGSDDSLRGAAVLKVIEPIPVAPATLPKTTVLHTGYVGACAADPATDIAVCSGLFGTSYEVNPPKNKVRAIPTHITQRIHFTGGDCANCGVVIDEDLAQLPDVTGAPTAIISTSKGYLPVELSPFAIQTIIPTNGEAISGQFGYDPVHHLILSPNYAILNLKHFNSGTPHYQIINATDSSAFDLSDNNTFFNANGTCVTMSGGTTQRDALPDSGAYDITTGIAYGTFRSPSDCTGANSVEDIALFDLTQATFDSSNGTWTDTGKQIETLTEMTDLTNGLTGIAIVPGQSIAIVADRHEKFGGEGGFGALSLPTSSGAGVPALKDWVQAEMPSDPSGKAWEMSNQPNSITAYVSPNDSKGYGVIANRTRTYAAVVDIEALLAAMRQAGTQHTLSSSVNLVTTGIVRFVNIRPNKS
jgi:hypothetical protein